METVQFLLQLSDNPTKLINQPMRGNRTALHEACRQKDSEKIVELLLKNKAHVNFVDDDGWNGVHFAAFSGYKNVVELLVDAKADMNKDTKHERMKALHLACFKGNDAVVEYLLNKGANVNDRANLDWLPIHFAATNGHMHCVRLLLNFKAQIDATRPPLGTALHIASQVGHLNVVTLLLNRKANPYLINQLHQTPLDVSISSTISAKLQTYMKLNPISNFLTSAAATSPSKPVRRPPPVRGQRSRTNTEPIKPVPLPQPPRGRFNFPPPSTPAPPPPDSPRTPPLPQGGHHTPRLKVTKKLSQSQGDIGIASFHRPPSSPAPSPHGTIKSPDHVSIPAIDPTSSIQINKNTIERSSRIPTTLPSQSPATQSAPLFPTSSPPSQVLQRQEFQSPKVASPAVPSPSLRGSPKRLPVYSINFSEPPTSSACPSKPTSPLSVTQPMTARPNVPLIAQSSFPNVNPNRFSRKYSANELLAQLLPKEQGLNLDEALQALVDQDVDYFVGIRKNSASFDSLDISCSGKKDSIRENTQELLNSLSTFTATIKTTEQMETFVTPYLKRAKLKPFSTLKARERPNSEFNKLFNRKSLFLPSQLAQLQLNEEEESDESVEEEKEMKKELTKEEILIRDAKEMAGWLSTALHQQREKVVAKFYAAAYPKYVELKKLSNYQDCKDLVEDLKTLLKKCEADYIDHLPCLDVEFSEEEESEGEWEYEEETQDSFYL